MRRNNRASPLSAGSMSVSGLELLMSEKVAMFCQLAEYCSSFANDIKLVPKGSVISLTVHFGG